MVARSLHRVLSVVAALTTGVAIGTAVFGIGYAELPSYLSSDPLTCTNCHVMQVQYDAWSRGPHHAVATCDDCHLPQDGVAHKLAVQLEDGALHGYAFTTGTYPDNIRIRASSLAVVNAACLTCHAGVTDQMRLIVGGENLTCTHCHSHIGH